MTVVFGRYHFSCVFEDNAALPEYKGSTFRGVLGHALKKVVCALKRQLCEECLLRQTCVYAFVFEGVHHGGGPYPQKKRIAAPPNPYVIEPPLETKTTYKAGEPFEFTLLLFGKANEYLPYFIYAIEQIGRTGIGRRTKGKAAGFTLRTVCSSGRELYSFTTRQMSSFQDLQTNLPDDLIGGYPVQAGKCTVKITLKTPLRLKYRSRLEPDLPFHVLIRAGLRRLSSLLTYHGSGEPQLDYKGLVHHAMDVQVMESSICWFDWRRYSNRQEQAMFMGGMVGEVTYADVPSEYLPILSFCQEVHLGKQTTFGLGKITVELS
ncbi:MAG: CRISPR system precrRNA processing endoribonuclease RAMP protein Cas6 [Desulfomonilia bacterium]